VLEAATNSSITFSWNAPLSNGGSPITGYKAYINALDEGDWKLIYDGTGQPTVLVWQQAGLKRGMHYRFKTSALNIIGEGANSTESTLLCAQTPSAPGQPQYVSSSLTSITIAWSSP